MSDAFLVFLIATWFPLLLGIIIFFTYAVVPVIPLLLGLGTIQGKGSSLGIFLGFISSFTFFRIFFSGIIYLFKIPIDYFQFVGAVFLALVGLMMLTSRYYIWMREKSGFNQGLIYSVLLGLVWSFWIGLFTLLPSDNFDIKEIDLLVIYTTFISAIGPAFLLLVLQKIFSKLYPQKYMMTIEKILGALLSVISILLLFHLIPISLREGIKVN